MKSILVKISKIGALCSVLLLSQTVIAKTDSIVAIVNEGVILESDVNQRMNSITSSSDIADLPDTETLKKQVIEQLINETLIFQEGKKLKINVTDKELDDALVKIATQNNLDSVGLQSYIVSLGINFDDYKKQIKKEILMDRIRIAGLRKYIKISDDEVDRMVKRLEKKSDFNSSVEISHIVIEVPDEATQKQVDEAKEKATLIIEKLNDGADFTALAVSYSDADDAQKGGYLGWNSIDALPSLFETPVKSAKKGQVIGPLQSSIGFHIVKVNDIKLDQNATVEQEEINSSHILIAINALTTDEVAKEKIEKIREDIVSGKMSFYQSAQLYSQDPGSAENGGELGWSNPDVYDPAFKAALINLEPGELSEPVKSQFGWHLIQLIDRRKIDATKSAQREQAYRSIFNRKYEEESLIWTRALRGDAYIKIIDDSAEQDEKDDNKDAN